MPKGRKSNKRAEDISEELRQFLPELRAKLKEVLDAGREGELFTAPAAAASLAKHDRTERDRIVESEFFFQGEALPAKKGADVITLEESEELWSELQWAEVVMAARGGKCCPATEKLASSTSARECRTIGALPRQRVNVFAASRAILARVFLRASSGSIPLRRSFRASRAASRASLSVIVCSGPRPIQRAFPSRS
jgi:hypothetical protein